MDIEEPTLAATDVSAVFDADAPIVVERAMYLSGGGQFWRAGHESAGVTAPTTSWFFAEGATGPYFDLFILLANPGDTDAQVRVTHLLPSGPPEVRTLTLPARSRRTLWVDAEGGPLADTAVSVLVTVDNGVPIVAERAMWWPGDAGTWAEAHNSPGATRTSTRWTVADGRTGGAEDASTFLLIANTSAVAGQARVTLLLADGGTRTKTIPLAPTSRLNVDVAVEFPDVVGQAFGSVVESVGDTPVQLIVERASYWDAGGQPWASGTNTLAMPERDVEFTVEVRPDGLSPDHVEIPVGGRLRFVNRTEGSMNARIGVPDDAPPDVRRMA